MHHAEVSDESDHDTSESEESEYVRRVRIEEILL